MTTLNIDTKLIAKVKKKVKKDENIVLTKKELEKSVEQLIEEYLLEGGD